MCYKSLFFFLQDTVLMNLYKRMFPKWTYDPHISDFIQNSMAKKSSDFELPVVEKIQLTKKKKKPEVEKMDVWDIRGRVGLKWPNLT